MRLTLTIMLALMMVGAVTPAFAELQNVEVGGSLRIRMNWWGPGADLSYDDDGNDSFSVEQRTMINVKADFTDDVTAFIELDSYNEFGDNFRGNANGNLNGVDSYSGTDIALYQGYIEMREAWGYPLTFRIGRQEVILGSEFLLGNNDTAAAFRGLSHDGVRMDYAADDFSITTVWSRIVQDTAFQDSYDSADVGVLYGSYTGLEDMTIDGYYIYTGLPQSNEAGTGGPGNQNAHIHTVGMRYAGVASGFDWDGEFAYQFGDSQFATPAGGVDMASFGLTASFGYTFDHDYQPRLFMKGTYFSGDDDDAAFNRLFSDHELSEFLGNTDLSNLWTVGGGVSAQVSEEIELTGVATYYVLDEQSSGNDDDLGLELGLYMTYNYSEDLYFEAGYAHFFAGDAIDGIGPGTNLAGGNGTFSVGSGVAGADDDLNYVYFETGISF